MTLQDILLKLARAAIEERFGKPFSFSKEILMEQFPQLSEQRATFVTINIDGDSLRGCIGSLLPHATLFDDVIYNAKAAAFSDKRFFPLSESEYPYCSIEISLLGLPEELEYSDAEDLKTKIRPGIDGVILQQEDRSATFLPQVWEEFPSFDHFFGQLGVKAGIRGFALDHHPRIYIYQVERFEDRALDDEEALPEDAAAAEPAPAASYATAQDAEAGFYRALEYGDLDAMLGVWADDDAVVCIHPGGERIQGSAAVNRSWREMLSGQPIMRFELEEVQRTGDAQLSVHTLRERIFVGSQLAGVALTTNVYKQEEGGWRMLMHHASPDPVVMR
ncbi:AmmeMemoRadiSam system protein A [Sulfurimonas sp. HSL-3221]|uniref:AmmeMemoRadiSam system protein A n=1 Tax=Sulfurimonadaceae TaxID=2771471 RepID=UPI001E52D5B9|nr:AmmeMemoRadiSam system protein A [Sulfurimonas sp. HSL-3221]UFS61543.1 AmmeMemoRadiSam system protein A [Sulfurimonas sp. HSL-3221]